MFAALFPSNTILARSRVSGQKLAKKVGDNQHCSTIETDRDSSTHRIMNQPGLIVDQPRQSLFATRTTT
jgi:hypothetical protein